MRFAVETWAPDHGASQDGALDASDAHVDLGVEVEPHLWGPRSPAPGTVPAASLLFVDGVERIDARVWVVPAEAPAGSGGTARLGVCASWAAGAVRCDGQASVVAAEVRRGLICPVEQLEPIVTRHGTYEPRPVRERPGAGGADPVREAIGGARGDLEARVAIEAAREHQPEMVVVDGPLGDRRHIPGAVGYVKAHHVSYLPAAQQGVVDRLAEGQRTPLFRVGERRFRYSWYLRLPGPGPGMALPHPAWGVVRCEAPGELAVPEAVACADRVTASLPRFASKPHQDARAPQNLHPIAGLERRLRHRMGDSALLERALRLAAVAG